jgi:hypothetical protein
MRRWQLTAALAIGLISRGLTAQVLTPMELQDPKLQHLQQRHLQTLMAIGEEIEKHKFPYAFYLCRTLDVDAAKMQTADLRSIRFDVYQHETVLTITGNYYASYAAEKMDADARLKETFQQVIVPILQAATPRFPDDSEFSAFAIEVSHHVRRNAMGVSLEEPENVVAVVPVSAAQKFMDARTDDARQAAVLEAQVFLNGEPRLLWLRDGAQPEEWKERSLSKPATQLQTIALNNAVPSTSAASYPSVSSALLKDTPPRIISAESLAGLERRYEDEIEDLVKGLDTQAHFVAYAPPSFIGFRQGSYLQLSITTSIDTVPTSSRYKLAALAFDEHISHLIRPLLDHFPQEVEFDGVDFSASLHTSADGKSEAVEFFFPYRVMRCFASYDCTGQQLLDAGTIIINGERATLDLQVAEGKN